MARVSIEETNVVDFIGVENSTGDVVLTITDHLDWEDDDAHLLLLQEKLNTYLRFIESGEIDQTYPQAENREVLINVVGKYPLSNRAVKVFDEAIATLKGAGIGLRYELFADDRE